MNSDQPAWTDKHEASLADVSDSEYWRPRGDFRRALRASVAWDQPMAFSWGLSGWWCSKNESNGAPRPTRPQTDQKEQDQ